MDSKSIKIVHDNRIEYQINNKLHRVDLTSDNKQLPAVIYNNGDKEYWIYGKLSRIDGGPAIEYHNGDFIYYTYNYIHRSELNGPAVKYTQGNTCTYEYWSNGKLHRNNGPAVIIVDLTKNQEQFEYWINGHRHRCDGPAVINEFASEFWENGRLMSVVYRNGQEIKYQSDSNNESEENEEHEEDYDY